VKFFPNIVDPDDDTNDNGMIDGNEIDNLTYYWDFGDGHYSTEKFPEHTYKQPPATFEVQLTVTDPENETHWTGRIVRLDYKEEPSTFFRDLIVINIIVFGLIIPIFILFRKKQKVKKSELSVKPVKSKTKKNLSQSDESDEDQITE
jgi:hypothetical protein